MLSSLIEDDIIATPLTPDQPLLSVEQPQKNTEKVVQRFTPAKHFSDLDRDMILAECTSEPHSTTQVSKQNDVSRSNIHYWAKKNDMEMPIVGLKRKIVEQCASGEVSPAKLAKTHGRDVSTVRNWVKQSGEVLPGKYVQNFSKPSSTVTQVIIIAPMYLQRPLWQWGASNVHLFVLPKGNRYTLLKTPLR